MFANRIKHGIVGSFGVLPGPVVTGRISGLIAGMAFGSVWWPFDPEFSPGAGRVFKPHVIY